MSKQSIRSSISHIQKSIKDSSIELDYDTIFEHYKKNRVSSYTLHLLIKTIQNFKEVDEFIANSSEFYTEFLPVANPELMSDGMQKQVDQLRSELKRSKKRIVILSFVCSFLFFCFAFFLFLYLLNT